MEILISSPRLAFSSGSEGSKKLEDYGIQGTLKQIKADERKQQIEKQNKEREKQSKKQKNKEQYNKKLNKKLDKNRKRG